MEISFIHTQILVHLHVNKTDFHIKDFALGLALKQRRKATRKSRQVTWLAHLQTNDLSKMNVQLELADVPFSKEISGTAKTKQKNKKMAGQYAKLKSLSLD